MKKLWIVLVLGLMVGAVAQDETARTINFICEGNRPLKVVFATNEAFVTFKGDQYMLPQATSGSTFRYTNERVTLEGNSTLVTLNNETVKRLMARNCRATQ
jgi:membrane-bound inhibitor of C-type lysozyme